MEWIDGDNLETIIQKRKEQGNPFKKSEIVDIMTRDGKIKKKKIRRIGDKWSTLQSLTFKNNTQPLHILMTPDEELLGNPIGYSYARSASNYINYLQCGLSAFETLKDVKK